MNQIAMVFNGDADGITSAIQVHLALLPDQMTTQQYVIATGIKRDIQLVDKLVALSASNEKCELDSVYIFDISLDKNRQAVHELLENNSSVFYCDHHFPGEIPSHEKLTTVIETSADVCTSLLVNGHLKGKYPEWAIVGAFGDNLKQPARKLAQSIGLSEAQTAQLESLGIAMNYNGYGPDVESLHFDPAFLYQELSKFSNPLDLFEQHAEIVNELLKNYQQDMLAAEQTEPLYATEKVAIIRFPNQPWALRVAGVYGNELANLNPKRAHAIVSENAQGGFQISVRAPAINKEGADTLCRGFETGGGRKGAAGINHLPREQLEEFINRMELQFN